MQLEDKVTKIKGVGEKTAALFEKAGINNIAELIEYYPRAYMTYGLPKSIGQCETEIKNNSDGPVAIEVFLANTPDIKNVRGRVIVSCNVRDASGKLRVTWFNQPYIKTKLHFGIRLVLFGKIVRKGGMLIMEQPKIYSPDEYRSLMNVLWPVYPLVSGLTNNAVSKAVSKVLAEVDFDKEPLPAHILKRYSLIKYKDAVRELHFPKAEETMREARKRIVFDEFFKYMLTLSVYKEKKLVHENGFVMQKSEECDRLCETLPYELTGAQKRVFADIARDMSGQYIMNRLVQGDVGSGKTIVAVLALLMTVKNGYQGCMMAPTEVLANQHYESVSRVLKGFDVNIGLLTGSMTAAEKKKVYEQIKNKELDIIIGTHALFQDKVEYNNLALVITDEQHRFGVKQREKLMEKGGRPHVLVMSATPIPRTLAMMLYGDMDISILDELPVGRTPIKNCVVDISYRPTAYRFIEQQLEKGHQAYVICPMVEESEEMDGEDVVSYTDVLRENISPKYRIEYMHGKLKQKEKNDIMEDFEQGRIHVLVSTTVIEVGVDVPNTTVMMIENAERFGLAQLHQLRGRVGRGSAQSYCIFINATDSKEAEERLKILNESNDGFKIAEEDLRLRGQGDLFGVRQSGELGFKIGDIYGDAMLLKQANEAAASVSDEEKSVLLSNSYFQLPQNMVV